MKMNRTLPAKIVRHFGGLGVPTPSLVRQRAMEIAKIDGRNSFTEQDWQQAKVELHGSNISLSDDGEDEMRFVSVHDMVPGSVGHHTQNQDLEDTQNIVEELVSEGMEEAIHDQMLEASKLEDTRE